MRLSQLLVFGAFLGTGLLAGCADGTPDHDTPAGQAGQTGHPPQQPVTTTDPGKPVEVLPSSARRQEAEELGAALAQVENLSAADVASRYATSFSPAPSYDIAHVAGLDKIQASSLKLSEAGLKQLGTRGFTLSDDHPFPTFVYGYSTLYLEDLPLYVSADSILYAIHTSYESILKSLEEQVLSGELETLLAGMQNKLATGKLEGADAAALADADVFLSVGRSLLKGSLSKPVAGGSETKVLELFGLAQAAKGTADVELFGSLRRNEDFSQFAPRSHYTDSERLGRYFKAMMWLGRIDLRLLETQEDGSQLLRRRQLQIAVMLRELIGNDLKASFDRIDRTVAAFVGEPDYMVPSQVDELLEDLGISSGAELSGFSDQQLAQALIDGDYGAQQISSHIMINGGAVNTLPLSRSFALLGPRYVIDSHVFSNVVYDRIGKRMMPNPLDAAFAALGNDQAVAVLAPELERYEATGYPAALARTRTLVTAHGEEFWNASLYNHWLGALQQLSPGAIAGDRDLQSLFPAARSEAWGRRLLKTQLASWAELRHDTVLYAKQSYTGGATCDFPDAYVDPYPRFYEAIAAYGARGAELVENLDLGGSSGALATRIQAHFGLVTEVAKQLEGMAIQERTGAALTAEQLSFINEAVVVQPICGSADFESGWYKKLFFNPVQGTEAAPTIADVHTQPTDEGGGMVGRVLHVGTGVPRLMVVVADNCSGPRAYAGLASSYREKITEDFERLDDPTWEKTYFNEPEVPWMQDLVHGSSGASFDPEEGI
jgi:hypothetical protein